MNLSQVDLKLLRVFIKIAECGGFSAARDELNMSQSTLSTHMSDLEHRLNLRLCERGRAGFRLTDEGRVVYEAAQKVFDSLDQFVLDIGRAGGRVSGELRIATIDAVASNPNYRLQEAIEQFNDRQGKVSLALHMRSAADVERGVAENKFDIGIGFNLRQFRTTHYCRLFAERQLLYCASTHPLFTANDADIDLDEVAKSKLVWQPYGPRLPGAHKAARAIQATTESVEAAALLILSGRYIGFLPEHYAMQWVKRQELRPIAAHSLTFELEGGMIIRKKPPHSAILRSFVADLLDVHGAERPPSVRKFLEATA